MMEETDPLSESEFEVLLHLKQGHRVAEMSKLIFLSPATICNYISEILQKLEAKNRIDAVAIAQSKGWLK